MFGSSGGHGSNSHVDIFADIVDEISREERYSFKVAKIYAEVPHDLIKKRIRDGDLWPCGPVPELTEEEVAAATAGVTDREVDKTPRVVAQMGSEPFIKALEGGADVILGGQH